MNEIVVISGKGGTGKTSVCAAFAHLMHDGIICDLDVDAPDLHIILEPDYAAKHVFVSGHEANIDQDSCTRCGECARLCRFESILENETGYAVDPLRCEGCGVCAALCPAEAIRLTDKLCGEWYESQSRFGPMIHAQLAPGEENSGRLVTLLKQKARERAKEQGLETILCDGSPGIGCPVISSLSGASMAVAVVEPTPSGRHDFARIADLCDHFRIPVCVIINKSDLSSSECEAIEGICALRGYLIAGKLPFSNDVVSAMIRKRAVTETESRLASAVESAWEAVTGNLAARKNEKISPVSRLSP